MAFLEAGSRSIARQQLADLNRLERLRRHEPTAWAELFEQHHPLVFRAVLAQVGDRPTAEDIAGQVFLEALDEIHRYRDHGRPLAGWLLAIARQLSLDWLQGEDDEASPLSPAGDGAELPAMSHRENGDALQLISTLPPEQREVVHLRFVEGYSLDDVARLTGRSNAAVRSLHYRALRSLRPVLGAANPDQNEGER